MKIRNGFVSNSSSSSFCIVGIMADKEDFIENSNFTEEELERFDEDLYEMYENLIAKGLYASDGGSDGETIYVGLEIDEMKDDETLGQFKERAMKALNAAGLTEVDKVHILTEGWYNG